MDKMVYDDRGNNTISNDGATILKLLEIVHPAAKTLVDIARSQDSEVTTQPEQHTQRSLQQVYSASHTSAA